MSLTDELRAAPPGLHGRSEFWGLAWEALAFVERTVQPGMATLETGAGASTIVFAARGADHEAVTPSQDEADRILAECGRRGIPTETLRFRIGSSADVLRAWEPRPLDLVLIDGAHAFPYPTLDWWYLAPHLKAGGLMLLDDAYMPPVAAVLDHVRHSAAWRLEPPASFRTAVARKLADETIDGEWKGRRMNFSYLPPGRRAVAAFRQRLFSTRAGLAALDLARSVGGRSGGRTG
ncbi:MAG TPA: class I SAM-dependent methyltransferase [Gaiellaceae bacterium]|nr:class I SAM-dependent methyltransferase [Gaiellaceae bacterium]